MKKPFLLLLLAASAGAFANEAADEAANRTAFAGQLTRAEVKADTHAAGHAGQLGMTEYAQQQQPASNRVRSRAELRPEAVKAARTRVIHEQI
jgi:hypothetical protein